MNNQRTRYSLGSHLTCHSGISAKMRCLETRSTSSQDMAAEKLRDLYTVVKPHLRWAEHWWLWHVGWRFGATVVGCKEMMGSDVPTWGLTSDHYWPALEHLHIRQKIWLSCISVVRVINPCTASAAASSSLIIMCEPSMVKNDGSSYMIGSFFSWWCLIYVTKQPAIRKYINTWEQSWVCHVITTIGLRSKRISS